jgi:hypothetical protein
MSRSSGPLGGDFMAIDGATRIMTARIRSIAVRLISCRLLERGLEAGLSDSENKDESEVRRRSGGRALGVA